MTGHFLLLYGSVAVMMLGISQPFLEHWWAVYIAGFIGATVLEYFTGVAMDALFKVRYWDYSAWGGLTLFMNYVLHKHVECMVTAIPEGVLGAVTILLTFYIAGDFVLAFKDALDFRDVLIQMEKAKDELKRMQKRIDVIIAVTEDELSEKREQAKDAIIERLRTSSKRTFLKRVHNYPTMSSGKYKEVLEELKRKLEQK